MHEKITNRGHVAEGVLPKLVVQDVQRKLLAAFSQPKGDAARATIQALRKSVTAFSAIDAAVVTIPDEAIRSQITRKILALGDEYAPSREATSLSKLVGVGAVFDGYLPRENGHAFRLAILGGLDTAWSVGRFDDNRPEFESFVIALPAYDLRPSTQYVYAMALAAGRSSAGAGFDMSMDTGFLWDSASEVAAPPLLYVFSIPSAEYNREGNEFTGQAFRQSMELIQAKVAKFNLAFPDARLRLLPPAPYSDALRPVQEVGLVATLLRDVEHLEEKFVEYAEQKKDEPRFANVRGNLQWVGFTNALVTLTTWPDEMTQTADVFLTNDVVQDAPSYLIRHRLSTLSTVSSVHAALEPALSALGIKITTLPAAPSPVDWGSNEETFFRDAEGRWIPTDFSLLPNAARPLVRNDNWKQTVVAESDRDFDEMGAQPYPVLYRLLDVPRIVQSHFRPDVSKKILELVAAPGLSYSRACDLLYRSHPGLMLLSGNGHWRDLSLPYDMYLAQHFHKCDGRIFRIKDSLIERLNLTDIEQGMPVASMRAPFADCYFHLETPFVLEKGKSRTVDEARVVGFFVTQQANAELAGGWHLAIGVMTTIGNDMLTAVSQEIELQLTSADPRGLLEAINTFIDFPSDELKITVEHPMYRALDLCAKVLIYLGLRSARLVERKDKTTMLEQARAKTSPGERKKLADKASKLYDYVDVGPERSMRQVEGDATGRGVSKVFWRRGFFRMQAYGPNWSMHRERWIEPTLVNPDSEDAARPAAKEYQITG